MQRLLKYSSFAGLALTVVPAFLSFYGMVSFAQHKYLMLAGTALWFITAPFWIDKKQAKTAQ